MRVTKFVPPRAVNDPNGATGSHQQFYGFPDNRMLPAVYDIYLVAGVFYVVRDNCVGVHSAAGSAYITGDDGKKLAAKLLKEYPRPETK